MAAPTLADAPVSKRLYYAHLACKKTQCVSERWEYLAMAIWGADWAEALEALAEVGKLELEFQRRRAERVAGYAA